MQYSLNEKMRAYFQDVITAQDIRSAMERLSSIGRLTLVLTDEEGRSVTCTMERGSPCSLPARLLREQGIRGCNAGSCPRMPFRLTKEIVYRDRPVGMLMGCVSHEGQSGTASEILELLAGLIKERLASEYAVNSLSEEVLNTYEEINLQYELSEEMGAVFNTRQVCDIVLKKVVGIIGAEKASILLYDPALDALRMVSSTGVPPEIAGRAMVGGGDGVCGYVYRTRRPLLVEDPEGLPADGSGVARQQSLEPFFSVPLLACPLKVKDKVIGVIGLSGRPFGRSYHSGHLKLLSSISSQAALSIYTSMLIKELKQNERIQKEMEIAEQIQRNLLPMSEKRMAGVDLAGRCIPARNVGGDYYDFFQRPARDGVDIVVADISGHGIGAAIMMAVSRGLLQSEALRHTSPSTLVGAVNRLLFQDLVSSEHFLTMLYLSYCAGTRRLAFSNAGHTVPLLLRSGSRVPEMLESEGMAIGVLEQISCEEKAVTLRPGDLLVAYTDGVVEAEDGAGRPFGMDRFIATLMRHRGSDAATIVEQSLRAVLAHVGTAGPESGQEDDITLVAMKVE